MTGHAGAFRCVHTTADVQVNGDGVSNLCCTYTYRRVLRTDVLVAMGCGLFMAHEMVVSVARGTDEVC